MTSIRMTDQGCMLRAYSREVVDGIIRSGAINTFIPALAYSLAKRPKEIPIKHEERHAGVSNYSLYRLVRLNFDLWHMAIQAVLRCVLVRAPGRSPPHACMASPAPPAVEQGTRLPGAMRVVALLSK